MVLADTDVVSYIFKRHSLAEMYLNLLSGHSLLVSFMTIAEIEYGMEADRWGEKRKEAMRSYVGDRFSIVYPDYRTTQIWAAVVASCEAKGAPIGFGDAWIAATALRLGAPLVSHNARDYACVDGLTVFTVATA